MAGFPPDKGEPFENGQDVLEGRLKSVVDRLDLRTQNLETTVATLRTEIAHLPSRNTLYLIVGFFIAFVGIVAIAYWNGTVAKFETINAKFETVNVKLDDLAKEIDRLRPNPVAPQPSSAIAPQRK